VFYFVVFVESWKMFEIKDEEKKKEEKRRCLYIGVL